MSEHAKEHEPASKPSLTEAIRTWLKIGLLSFGGPAGQIAMMHKELVDDKKWIGEQKFLTGLNFCMLLPGPEAMQLATYVGWRMHGTKGGLAAGLLFVLPGACVMLILSLLYAAYGSLPISAALFTGVKAAVLAVVIEALLRVSKRALKGQTDWLIAAAAFFAIFLFGVPFPIIVIGAAVFGFFRASGHKASVDGETAAPVPISETVRTVVIWLAIWIIPLLGIALIFGSDHVLSQMAWFFSKLAVVTFGGAYAVLAYMSQEVVNGFGWLKAGEMLDALGLAETTPGPLILVTQFVGTLAAWRQGGGPELWMGVLGAVVTLWATFAPCFLWIFAGAPYVERIAAAPKLKSALAAITAAVVGVILSLTLWFALHVLFTSVTTTDLGPLHVQLPSLASVDWVAAALTALAIALMFIWHQGIVTTLAVCGALAVAWHYAA